jgi:hypothetical protein
MKKLIVLGALSLFGLSFSGAAHACDGMRAQHGDTQAQASKTKATKHGKSKKDDGGEGGETTKS